MVTGSDIRDEERYGVYTIRGDELVELATTSKDGIGQAITTLCASRHALMRRNIWAIMGFPPRSARIFRGILELLRRAWMATTTRLTVYPSHNSPWRLPCAPSP